MSSITIKDVAKRAGVSISTVSRYLQDKTSIKHLSAIKIEEAIEELNYIPNNYARNLRSGSSNIIGFVQPDISQDLFNQCMKSMNQIFYQNNYLLITCDTNNNPEKERHLIDSLIKQNVRAIVVVTCGNNTSYLNEIAEKTNNLIIANRPEPTINANSIAENQVDGGYRIAKYMIGKGCRRFGILYGVPYSAASKYRLEGIMKAFAEEGITVTPDMMISNCVDFNSTLSAAEKLLEHDIDCLLFSNQRSSSGVIQAVKDCGRDVKFAGFTSKLSLEQSKTKFPCIMEDTVELGLLISDFVMSAIKRSPKNIKKVIFRPALVDIDGGYIEEFSLQKE